MVKLKGKVFPMHTIKACWERVGPLSLNPCTELR